MESTTPPDSASRNGTPPHAPAPPTEEALFRALIENGFDAVVLTSADGVIRYTSPSCQRVLGLAAHEIAGRSGFDFIHPDDRESVREGFLGQAGQPGSVASATYRVRHRDGSWRWLEARRTNLLADPGVGAMVTTFRDVTDRREAEEALRRSEARFRQLFEHAGDALFVYDAGFRFVEVNQRACESLGYTRAELIGRPVDDVEMPVREADRLEVQEQLLVGVAVTVEGQHRRKDGSTFPVEVTITLLESGGRPLKLAVARDASERRRAEEALAAERNLLRAVIDHLPDHIYTKDVAGRYVLNNAANLRLLGAAGEADLAGKTVFDLFPADLARQYDHDDRQVLQTGTPLLGSEECYVGPGGITGWYWTTKVPLRDARGQVTGLVGISRDVTARKRDEQALREQRNLLQHILEHIPCAVFWKDRDSVYLGCNTLCARNLGRNSPEELAGKTDREVCADPAEAEYYRQCDRKVLDTGEPLLNVEETLLRPDGSRATLLTSKVPLRNDRGEVVGVLGVSTDITERKRADAALRESQDRFSAFMAHSPAVTWMKDEAGRYVYVNPTLERVYRRTGAEVLGRTDAELLPAPVAARLRAHDVATLEAGGPMEFAEVIPDSEGRERHWQVVKFPARDAAGRPFVGGFAVEATERVRAEERLRASEERYRRIVETTGEGIWAVDADGRTTFANRRLADMFGCPPEAMTGRPFTDFVGPDDRAEAEARMERRRRGESERVTVRFRRLDGSELWARLSTDPVFDDRGRFAGALAMVTDITDERQLEQQFREAQKLDAVGRLAGGVAHDFNNLLTVINGFAEIVLGRLPADDPSRELLGEIRKAGERAAGLTRQLLAFSRRQLVTPRVLDLNAVVGDTGSLLRRLIGEDVDLVTALDPSVGPIKADRGQLEQVLLNLAVNARDAMPQGGTLTVTTRPLRLGPGSVGELPAGEYAVLEVSDTGVGMTEEVRARVFEPFFTTKDMGKGTGLGLAVVHGVVQQSRGHVEVESRPGRGTTFRIFLPRHAAPAPAAESPAVSRPVGGGEVVLVVEDESAVRGLILSALRAHGYRVLEAPDGAHALEVSRAYDGPLHLLLTDVVMPGKIGGRRLAERLRAERPGIRVLFMSGYTDDAVVRHGLQHDEVAFLRKPFAPASLAQKVREVLDGPRG